MTPTKWRNFTVFLALAAVLLLPSAAMSDLIAVTAGDFTGSRSTLNSPSGLVTTDGWTSANGGFIISWAITQEGSLFHYVYTFSNAAGEPLRKTPSHFIVELSNPYSGIIQDAAVDGNGVTLEGPKIFEPGSGNPYMTGNIYGIKLDAGGNSYSFYSDRAPVWGDFYSKDGVQAGIVATAYNTGFGTDPTGDTTAFTNWVPTPDTQGVPNVPVPPTVLLLGSGLLGLGFIGWRKRK